MLKTKAGEQEIMDYLAKLFERLNAKEQALKKSLLFFLNAEERGEDPVVRDENGRVIPESEVTKCFYYFHYANADASERAMRKPREYEDEIKAAILSKMEILKELGIPFENPSKEILNWLGIEGVTC